MRDFRPHLTVAAVIERDGRFLLVEEHVGGQRVFNQPAGHVEDGETLLDAVRRETHEETGWAFEPTLLLGVYRWLHPENGETFIRFAFRGDLGPRLAPGPVDPAIVAADWHGVAALNDGTLPLRSPLVRRCVEDYRAGCGYPLTALVDLSG